MNVNRQTARSASTRAKLIRAARALFARNGYAGVATEQIVRRAGVTRGALYHQFQTKEDLFLAVYEQVEQELTERVVAGLGTIDSPLAELRAGVRGFLEACRAPEVQRIALIDASRGARLGALARGRRTQRARPVRGRDRRGDRRPRRSRRCRSRRSPTC